MNAAQVLRRLQAYKEGRALPRGETRQVTVQGAEDTLILCFVKMGGESAPWGIAWGHPGSPPQTMNTAEPRTRDDVATMAAAFTPSLLGFLQAEEAATAAEVTRLPQVWLPNRTHLEMLHHLAYAYARTRWGDPARARTLNALGRATGWLFREASRPGQQCVVVATEALRQAYTFPSEDARQGHLGYLLAWLSTKGGKAARLAAAGEAERHSMATSLNPELERGVLLPPVERFNKARRAKSPAGDAACRREAETIGTVIDGELQRRYELAVEAWRTLRADKRRENRGLEALRKESRAELFYQYLRHEASREDELDGPVYAASPETDFNPRVAAHRYFVCRSSADLAAHALLSDDRELQAEAIASGDAIRGTIVDVTDEGSGKGMVPVWTIEAPNVAPLRLREGNLVSVAEHPGRAGDIRAIQTVGGKNLLRVELVIGPLKTKPQKFVPSGWLVATDPDLGGTVVTLIPASTAQISRGKIKHIWNNDAPGAWLMHARPEVPGTELPADVAGAMEKGGEA